MQKKGKKYCKINNFFKFNLNLPKKVSVRQKKDIKFAVFLVKVED